MTGEAVLSCSDVTIGISEGLFSRITESLPMLEPVTGKVLHMESLAPPLVVSPLTRRTAVEEVVKVVVEPNVVDVTAVDDVDGTEVSLMVVGRRGVEEVLVSLRV